MLFQADQPIKLNYEIYRGSRKCANTFCSLSVHDVSDLYGLFCKNYFKNICTMVNMGSFCVLSIVLTSRDKDVKE